MSRLMIIGCGGVASVAIHKCCQNREVFDEIMIASRTVAKCDALKEKLIQDGQAVDALSGNTVQGGQAADALSENTAQGGQAADALSGNTVQGSQAADARRETPAISADSCAENMDTASKTPTKVTTAQIDADDVEALTDLIRSYQPDAVLNVALPYQDLTIMDACLAAGVHYIDTANYETEDTSDPAWRAIYEERCKRLGFSTYFDYSWQWAYQERYEKAGLTALLGTGFDPGVTSVYVAYAQKHYFDEIHTIDILDCNGGDHGYPFATNFNPEINLREVSAPGSYWEDGKWVEIPPMTIKREYEFAGVGKKDMYLLHHEEIEALAKNIPGVKRIRFFMTFGQSYLTHMKCLENVGMLSTTPVHYNGQEIVPIQFLKELLPDPASLGPRTVGKTNIGCIFTGVRDGKEKSLYIYNVCDHQECYREVGSQAISYTTGVPAMIGAMMVVTGQWRRPGVFTTDEFDPDPYMEALNRWGLPWVVEENPVLVD